MDFTLAQLEKNINLATNDKVINTPNDMATQKAKSETSLNMEGLDATTGMKTFLVVLLTDMYFDLRFVLVIYVIITFVSFK